MIKISVIIPVYNSGKTLNRVIYHLSYQTSKDFEVVFVDDGSTDNSAEIIQAIDKNMFNFQYIYQKNQGVSVARNQAISYANGKYLMFIDPDDYFEPNFIEEGIRLIQNSDLGIFSFVIEQDSTEKILFKPKHLINGVLDRAAFLTQFMNLFDEQLMHALWNKVYRKSIIDEHHLTFPSIRMGEDLDFNFQYFGYVRSACTSSDELYHYIEYDYGTATTVYHGDEFQSNYNNQMSLIYFLKSNDIYDERRLSLHWALMLGFRFSAVRKLKKENDSKYLEAKKQYEDILKMYRKEKWVKLSALPSERLIKYIVMSSYLRLIYI